MFRVFLAASMAAFLASATAQAQVTFDWATIGNPGNAPNIFDGLGSVDYTYRISKHEVTNAQYTEFLNAVDPTGANALDLYLEDSGTPLGGMADNFGGIELQAGNPDGSKFVAQAGREQNPVSFVSFFDAMRFTNWLHNGQGSGDTESGVYTIGSGIDEVRSADAQYFIPTLDEWHKAAFYDPSLNGGSGGYHLYPTQSDDRPYSDNPGSLNTPDDTNVINGKWDDEIDNGYNGGFAVSGTNVSTIDLTTNPLTDVGAYALSVSAYGTFDQAGNVNEWNEDVTLTGVPFIPDGRGISGGSWSGDTDRFTRADGNTGFDGPLGQQAGYGFRVAAVVPEPSTGLLGAIAAFGIAFDATTETALDD